MWSSVRINSKYNCDGDGIVSFTTTSLSLVISLKYLKCSTNGWFSPLIFPDTLAVSGLVSIPLKAYPFSPWTCSIPFSPQKKSRCQYARRNSPSVTPFNPAAICFSTSSAINLSSTFVNSSLLNSPFWS